MYDLNLVEVNRALVNALQVCAAIRRMIGKNGEGYSAVQDMEGGIRAAASECQRVIELEELDKKRSHLR